MSCWYCAAAAEYRQTHPIALQIIIQEAKERRLLDLPSSMKRSINRYGIKVTLKGEKITSAYQVSMESRALLFLDAEHYREELLPSSGYSRSLRCLY